MKTLRALSAILLAAVCIFGTLRAAEIPASEKTKIEAILTCIEKLEGAVFIRNGSEYDPKSAAKFLRKKWQAHGQDITTAADFIAKMATESSTSGKPYLIRLKDGTELKCADHLSAELKKLETPPAEKHAPP